MFRVSLLAIAVLVVGCGRSSDRVAVYPVEGRLVYNGQPLAGAQVVFHPRESADRKVFSARAQTDTTGAFKLSTYDAFDGAAEGLYAVTVHYYPVVRHDDGYVAGQNILPPKYAAPHTTDLKLQVAKGPNTLSNLEIKR